MIYENIYKNIMFGVFFEWRDVGLDVRLPWNLTARPRSLHPLELPLKPRMLEQACEHDRGKHHQACA